MVLPVLEESLVVSRTSLSCNVFLGMVKMFQPFESGWSEEEKPQATLCSGC